MKFFLDENTPIQVANHLQAIYRSRHEFVHPCLGEDPYSLKGAEDEVLFGKLADHSFDCILTGDIKQSTRKNELQALFDSGLNWIGIKPTGQGLELINGLCAGFMIAVSDFLQNPPSEPTLIFAYKPNTPPRSKRLLMREELSKNKNWKSPQQH